MAQNIYKYQGTNDELFRRTSVGDYDAQAVVIVPDTHSAIVIKDGKMMTTLNSGSHQLFDAQSGFFTKPKRTENHIVDIIYLSKTYKLKILWGTLTKFSFRDPNCGVAVKAGANGEFTVQIENPRKAYLELIGSSERFTAEQLKEYLTGRLMSEIEPAIAKAMEERKLSYDRLDENKKLISDDVFPAIAKIFSDEFGLSLYSFIISGVAVDSEAIEAIESESLRKLNKADGELISDRAYCTSCGSKLTIGEYFCAHCGYRILEGRKLCKRCDKANLVDAAYCCCCGEKFD